MSDELEALSLRSVGEADLDAVDRAGRELGRRVREDNRRVATPPGWVIASVEDDVRFARPRHLGRRDDLRGPTLSAWITEAFVFATYAEAIGVLHDWRATQEVIATGIDIPIRVVALELAWPAPCPCDACVERGAR